MAFELELREGYKHTVGGEKGKGPTCGAAWDVVDEVGEVRRVVCRKRSSPHFCEPRAIRVNGFFSELLVHTKGPWARRAFVPADFQRREILDPLFGIVVWSEEWSRYVRLYRVAWLDMGRKNGKSALDAGIVLYMTVGDDEESAEVYGAAKNTRQASKVAEPAYRMVELSPVLSKRLRRHKSARRLYDIESGSVFEVIPSDELGELGHNPHLAVIDEVLALPDGGFWRTMRSAMGARAQPLLLASTTAPHDKASFCAKQREEMRGVLEDPDSAPHVFVYLKEIPETIGGKTVDPFDERYWHLSNPGIDIFKSRASMREELLEALGDPQAENEWIQYHANREVDAVTRYIGRDLWDECDGDFDLDDLATDPCYIGLDLASTTDLASECLVFPPHGEREWMGVAWRHWTTEAMLPKFTDWTGGKALSWAEDGYLSVTEGDWIDFHGDPETGRSYHRVEGVPSPLAIHPQVAADVQRFRVAKLGFDPWQATSTAQAMQRDAGVELDQVRQGYSMSEAIKEIKRLTQAGLLRHRGDPVGRWCVLAGEVKRNEHDLLKIVKPVREQTSRRIDGFSAFGTAVHAWIQDEKARLIDAASSSAPAAETGADGFFRPVRSLDL